MGAPIHVFNLIRDSRRAELQRRRMVRMQKVQKSLENAERPESVLESKQESLDEARAALAQSDARLEACQEQLESSKLYLEMLDRQHEDLSSSLERRPGFAIRLRVLERKLDHYRTVRERALQEFDRLKEQNNKARWEVLEAQEAVQAQRQINERLQEGISDTGALTEKGDVDSSLPSLQEIADYAEKKNRRGHARRTVKAVLSGIGVAGGGLGLAAGIMALAGGAAAVVASVGLAAAVIGAVAGAVGLGMAIWKLVNWVKKRRKQALRMKAAGKKTGFGVYAPWNKKIDHKVKRRHYATSLVTYAVRGDPSQRAEAIRIMNALDAKHDWGKTVTRDMPEGERTHLIQHFRDKMKSG